MSNVIYLHLIKLAEQWNIAHSNLLVISVWHILALQAFFWQLFSNIISLGSFLSSWQWLARSPLLVGQLLQSSVKISRKNFPECFRNLNCRARLTKGLGKHCSIKKREAEALNTVWVCLCVSWTFNIFIHTDVKHNLLVMILFNFQPSRC